MIGIGGAGQAMQFEDELHMAASPYTDVQPGVKMPDRNVSKDSIERDAQEESDMRNTLPPRAMNISDHTGFRQSDNIYDQRDNPRPTLGEQFQDQITSLKGQLFGPTPPPDPEVPVNPIGQALGMQDIKAPDSSYIENIMQSAKLYGNLLISDITGSNIMAVKIFQAAKDMYRGHDDNYNTLTYAEDEDKYKAWKDKHAPNDKGDDYDLRGAFKAGVVPDSNGHMPDTFKKPNHITFSDESKYSNSDTPGGHWDKTDKGWDFTPSSTNLKYHSKEELQNYFDKSEPESKLILPE